MVAVVLHCGSLAAHNLRHRPGTLLPDCLHSVLCWLMLRLQNFSIISIHCPLMTHHPNKSHLSICKDSSVCGRCLWMDVARGRPLEQRPSPWLTLSCSPSGQGWPRSTAPRPQPQPGTVFLAQTSSCSLWTPGFRITHSLILPLASARIQEEGSVVSLSLTQLFPCSLYYWLNCGSQSWISLPFVFLRSVSGKDHLCT